jgi:hypothetical protein
MPADPRQTARLRELHEDYAWKVNAAIAEGRDDLIDALCEEYADEAVRLITGTPPGGPSPPPSPPPPPPRFPPPAAPPSRWRSLLTGSRSRRPGRGVTG